MAITTDTLLQDLNAAIFASRQMDEPIGDVILADTEAAAPVIQAWLARPEIIDLEPALTQALLERRGLLPEVGDNNGVIVDAAQAAANYAYALAGR